MNSMLPCLDDALNFVDSVMVRTAPRYARFRPEAIPDLLQEARVAVWQRWQKSPDQFSTGLCFHVSRTAFYHFCVQGTSVDSHLIPARPHERPHGEYAIVSLEQAFADLEEGEWAGNEPEWKFDAGREEVFDASPPNPRYWELRALDNVLLDQLDRALEADPSARYTLRKILEGYTAREIARERNLSRWRIYVETKHIIATGRQLWGIPLPTTIRRANAPGL